MSELFERLNVLPPERRLYVLRHLPYHLIQAQKWNKLEGTLCNFAFIEAKTRDGLVLDLAGDFTAALKTLPAERPSLPILQLLEEAIRADVHFIARHPEALFQCLWNRCWWFDCHEAERHYNLQDSDRQAGKVPREGEGHKLSDLLESWHSMKERQSPGFLWMRSLRPPPDRLGGGQRMVLRGHESTINALSVSSDGSLIASSAFSFIRSTPILIWDTNTGALLLSISDSVEADQITFSPDSKRLVVGSLGEVVEIRNATTGTLIHRSSYEGPSHSPDGYRVLTWLKDGSIRVREVDSGRETAPLRGPSAEVKAVTSSSDGSRLAGIYSDNSLWVWDLEQATRLQRISLPEAGATTSQQSPRYEHFSFRPDGSGINLADSEGTVHLVDVVGGSHAVRVCDDPGFRGGIAVSPDGKHFAFGHEDTSVRVLALPAGEPSANLYGHDSHVGRIIFSPNGRYVISGSADHTLRVWDLTKAKGGGGAELRGHDGDVVSLSFSPNGKLLASGGDDKTIRLWDCSSGMETGCLRGHEIQVEAVAFAPDGKRIVSGSSLGDIRVWDVGSCSQVICIGSPGAPTAIRAVAFSADGKQISATFDNRMIHVIDADTGDYVSVRGTATEFEHQIEYGVATTTEHGKDIERLETQISAPDTKKNLAWLPVRLVPLVSDRAGRMWAGASGRNVYLYKLEGLLEERADSDQLKAWEVQFFSQAVEFIEAGNYTLLRALLDYQSKLYREAGVEDHLYYSLAKVTKRFTRAKPLQEGLIDNRYMMIEPPRVHLGLEFLKTAEDVYRKSGSKYGLLGSLSIQAGILNRLGHAREALALSQEQQRICRELNDRKTLQRCLGERAELLKENGEMEAALALFAEQETICRGLGDVNGLQRALFDQALVLKAQGNVDGAMVLLKSMEKLSRDTENKALLSGCLGAQATTLYVQGKWDEASQLFKEQQQICRALGDLESLVSSLTNQALLLTRESHRPREALAIIKEAYEIVREYKMMLHAQQVAQRVESTLELIQRHVQEENMARWKSLPRWKRFFLKKPNP